MAPSIYHSFPRRSVGKNRAKHGLSTLKLMTKMGLLYTPEVIHWQEPGVNAVAPRPVDVAQKRICFTALQQSDIQKHSDTFGPLSIEFPYEIFVRMGGFPVMYLPPPVRVDEGGYAGLAASLMSRLVDAIEIVERLKLLEDDLARRGDPNEKVSVHYNAEMAVAFESVRAAGQFLAWVNVEHATLTEILGAVHNGIASLFYPTENLEYTEPLGYFRQLEWRLFSKVSRGGVPLSSELAEPEKAQLLELDSGFFGREIDIPRFGRSRLVERCLALRSFENAHILSHAKAIYSPDNETGRAAEEILRSANLKCHVVCLE
jgi:hypothetical protein